MKFSFRVIYQYITPQVTRKNRFFDIIVFIGLFLLFRILHNKLGVKTTFKLKGKVYFGVTGHFFQVVND